MDGGIIAEALTPGFSFHLVLLSLGHFREELLRRETYHAVELGRVQNMLPVAKGINRARRSRCRVSQISC